MDYCAFLAPFETLHKKLIKEDLCEKSGYFPASVKAKLKDIAYSGYRSYSRPDFLFSKEDIKLLDNLKNDNNIVIVKPDKGNGVVILGRNDYNKKMNDILQDNMKFQRLNDDPVKLTLQRENQLKKLLATLKKSESITPETYDKLYPTGSRIGILYGLPKIHKNNVPLRPILSCINNYSYKVAKFFIPLLNPLSVGSYMMRDSFSFVQELLNLNFNSSSVVMASFDVTSLFTNIPLDKTIDIISNCVFANAVRFHGLTRCEFRKLLCFAVKNCHFLFNGVLYQQIDGIAMGSPLGPLFANIFLSFHEKVWLSKCPADFKPLLYCRYVDDCFLLFKSTDQISQFLDFLNSQHPNIKFTCEIESNSTLPFLDISIIRKNGVFETSVFQKPTFTGLFTNSHSFIPSQYKCNLISFLVHRLYNICSNYENFQAQLESLRQILNRNSYPTRLFDSCVRTFLDKVSQPKPIVHSVSKKVLYFSLPYTGKHSLQIRTQISRLCSSAYPHLNIRFVFRPTLRLSHLFSFKDKTPKALRSCVVYSFKCRCCSASYLGQTVRHLHTRVSEHLGFSALTGRKSCSPVMSSIFSHLNSTGHTASSDDFQILSSCSSPDELLVRESLLISKYKPSLNIQGSSVPLLLL